MNFDGHKIKNGFKLTASGLKRLYKHKFDSSKINLPVGYELELDGIPLNDFRNMCEYYF